MIPLPDQHIARPVLTSVKAGSHGDVLPSSPSSPSAAKKTFSRLLESMSAKQKAVKAEVTLPTTQDKAAAEAETEEKPAHVPTNGSAIDANDVPNIGKNMLLHMPENQLAAHDQAEADTGTQLNSDDAIDGHFSQFQTAQSNPAYDHEGREPELKYKSALDPRHINQHWIDEIPLTASGDVVSNLKHRTLPNELPLDLPNTPKAFQNAQANLSISADARLEIAFQSGGDEPEQTRKHHSVEDMPFPNKAPSTALLGEKVTSSVARKAASVEHTSGSILPGAAPTAIEPATLDVWTEKPTRKTEAMKTIVSSQNAQNSTAQTQITLTARPVLSAENAPKISDALITLRDVGGQIDVALTPDDMGRLTIKLDHTTQGPAFTLTAERAETQEIIRRHLDQLQQQFRAMGIENATFSFGDQGDGPAGQSAKSHREDIAKQKADDSEQIVQIRQLSTNSGLDIRI